MGAAPAVNHRAGGVGSHARRAQQVPAGVAPQTRRDYPLCAGGLQNLTGAGDAVVQHGPGVVADGVVNLGRGDAVAVGEGWVEGDAVVLFGQVFGS